MSDKSNNAKRYAKLQLIQAQTPEKLLAYYKIDYTTNGVSYKFSASALDSSPSAFCFLNDSGTWWYKNHSKSSTFDSGSYVKLLQEITGEEDEEIAIEKLLKIYNGTADYDKDLTSEEKARLEELRELNKAHAKRSRIVYHVESLTRIDENNIKAKEFLISRGIKHIPDNAYEIKITHKVQPKKGNAYTAITEGICIPFGDISEKDINADTIKEHGMDIHLYEPFINKQNIKVKTKSFGDKQGTYIMNDSLVFSPFESKMDYFAVNYLDDVVESNILLANGVSQVQELIEKTKEHIKNNNINESDIVFNHYNQNDYAGCVFNRTIAQAFPKATHTILKYASSEQGLDINDLEQRGVVLSERRVETSISEMLKRELHQETKKNLQFIAEAKEQKIDMVTYLLKNMHKFYDNDAPVSNLLILASSNYNSKKDIKKHLDFNSLKEDNVYLNKGVKGTYLYKKTEADSFKVIKHFNITQTNLARNKDAKDAYDYNLYHINTINESENPLELFEKSFSKKINGIEINNSLSNNQEKLFDLFKQVVSNYTQDKDRINTLAFVIYSRVDYRSIDVFNNEIKDSFLSLAKDERSLKLSLQDTLRDSKNLYDTFGIDNLVVAYKSHEETQTQKAPDLREDYPSYKIKEELRKTQYMVFDLDNNEVAIDKDYYLHIEDLKPKEVRGIIASKYSFERLSPLQQETAHLRLKELEYRIELNRDFMNGSIKEIERNKRDREANWISTQIEKRDLQEPERLSDLSMGNLKQDSNKGREYQ